MTSDKCLVAFILCLECKYKWTARFKIETSLFMLECPRCGEHNSFPSFVPQWYLDEIQSEEISEWEPN